MMGYFIGWVGVLFGLFVAPPQLWKIITTGQTEAISLATYTFLCLALVCYLLHAIYIRSPVFITAQAVNLVTNTTILILLVRRKKRAV